MKKRQKQVRINDIKVGADAPFFLIAGPCVIESEESLMRHAEELKRIQEEVDIPLIFKSSYDKANRTSVSSFRGLGIKEGLKLLS
ncbi:MAG TPA: 3-deoxy-8-phosphooctulonate synthase, partial [Candidatus Omnitrophica bacterium]|nr:3-deoxy-8-phosphooctulonate synthase [Candidatus Omnitrophota bacterium]